MAKLLSVKIENRKKLDPGLVEYDTIYYDGPLNDNEEYYPLPNGLLLVLTFTGEKLIPFTTIRRATAKKQEYYERNIGQWFDIVYKPAKGKQENDNNQSNLFEDGGKENGNEIH